MTRVTIVQTQLCSICLKHWKRAIHSCALTLGLRYVEVYSRRMVPCSTYKMMGGYKHDHQAGACVNIAFECQNCPSLHTSHVQCLLDRQHGLNDCQRCESLIITGASDGCGACCCSTIGLRGDAERHHIGIAVIPDIDQLIVFGYMQYPCTHTCIGAAPTLNFVSLIMLVSRPVTLLSLTSTPHNIECT